eukprot:4270418-Prymnesium_polylepis.1
MVGRAAASRRARRKSLLGRGHLPPREPSARSVAPATFWPRSRERRVRAQRSGLQRESARARRVAAAYARPQKPPEWPCVSQPRHDTPSELASVSLLRLMFGANTVLGRTGSSVLDDCDRLLFARDAGMNAGSARNDGCCRSPRRLMSSCSLSSFGSSSTEPSEPLESPRDGSDGSCEVESESGSPNGASRQTGR